MAAHVDDVGPEELHRAIKPWHARTYVDLVLDDLIANDVPPWGLLGKLARAVVRDEDQTPYLDSSTDQLVHAGLHDEWPPDDALDVLPDGRHGAMHGRSRLGLKQK